MFECYDEEEMIQFGKGLGQLLQARDLIILTGDLGAGKTTLTKGLAQGLGIEQMIKSPTYTIVRAYEGRLPLYHLDVYRIGGDADSIDLDEFVYHDGVTVIEWGMMLDGQLPEEYLEIVISSQSSMRQLTLNARGLRAEELVEQMGHG